MVKDHLFLPDEAVDMDPNMTNRLQQHTVVLDDGAQASTSYSRFSPPKAIIDSSPLQSAMDKNKESLKVKLLVRRSFDQLVQQGIMPPLKTSPAIYEQRRQLERAKTGDLLKAKIKKRPDRVELEQRHILEQCDSNVDPSLAEKRRMLEKALLVDHLNSKISHRPGPLDLIGKNILHVEEPIERMVKEGLVDYASTLDESNVSVATPSMVGEGEDSLSSEGESLHSVAVALVSQPGATTTLLQRPIQLQALQTPTQQPQTVLATAKPEFFTLKPTIPIVVNDGTVLAAIATPVVTTATAVATITAVTGANIATVAEVAMEQGTGGTISTPTSTLRPILPTPSANISGDLASVRPTLTMTTMPSDIKLLSSGTTSSSSNNNGNSFPSGGGKEKLVKKKSKSKSITKAKPIKFHEYKGPPNAHKGSSSSSSSVAGHGSSSGGGGSDNNYQLIMQQQYLLEYLEEMCKKPTGVSSPSSREPPNTTDGEEIAGSDHTPIDSPLSTSGGGTGSGPRSKNSSSGGISSTMPTSPATIDVTVETLNKLKVSQLKKYCKQYSLAVSGTKSNLIERLKQFIKSTDANTSFAGSPAGVSGTAVNGVPDSELEDNLLAEQQKRIAELQLQLKKSQEELEQFRSLCNNPFVGSGTAGNNGIAVEEPMVINASVAVPPPPPPPPPPTLSTVLVGSPFSLSTGDSCEVPCGDGRVGGDAVSAGVSDQTSTERVSSETTTVPALEGSFLLEGLTAANANAVDYGHDMGEILPPELRSTLPIDRSPTHRPTLDKVLGQVQPTISGLTMNTDANEDRSGLELGMRSLPRSSLGTMVGSSSNVGARGVDMQDLSLSMKSVNVDTVNDAGDTSMQQDTMMLNDFDIDLVDFPMHSLDSDGPFPMLTNHDPDPTGSSDHRQHTVPLGTIGLFCNRADTSGGKMLSNGFADQSQTQHMHDDMLHDHPNQHTFLNNNDLVSSSDDASVMLHLDLMDHNDHQASLTAPTSTKQLTFGGLHHPQHHLQQNEEHHANQLQQQQQRHQQQHHSDSNNNTNYNVNRSAIGLFRFTVQDQPVASTSTSSSSSSTSSSPSNCFRGLGTSFSSKHANKQNHHLNLHQQQQQQQHHQQQHQQHQQHQQQQQHHNHLLDQLSTTPSTTSDNNAIDSFQDNAMDFESMLTNDTDSVLTANNCHRMMLDCAQDKPMLGFLPEPSILDYFSEDCNGLDYEIKHLEY